jgi:glycosyltransferase involved in cell wall biosynthesis
MERKISVVIHTYNSEQYLERVLKSVSEFDEIVVCDMYSTDRTIEIANMFNCKIVYHEKCDIVEPARNFAIQSASHEWVLVVDSDELVPDELRQYLYNRIGKKDDLQALWIPRKNFMMGRFLHGEYPDYILRFFKKESVDWPPYVHVLPKIKGNVGHVPKRRKEMALIHLINDSVSKKLQKINIYTENEIFKRSEQHFSGWGILMASFFRFFKSYILKGGFRDGKVGIVIACLSAFYKFVTIAKIWESKINPENRDDDLKE